MTEKLIYRSEYLDYVLCPKCKKRIPIGSNEIDEHNFHKPKDYTCGIKVRTIPRKEPKKIKELVWKYLQMDFKKFLKLEVVLVHDDLGYHICLRDPKDGKELYSNLVKDEDDLIGMA